MIKNPEYVVAIVIGVLFLIVLITMIILVATNKSKPVVTLCEKNKNMVVCPKDTVDSGYIKCASDDDNIVSLCGGKADIFKPCDGNTNGNTPLLCPKFTKNIGDFACSKSDSASDVESACGGSVCTGNKTFSQCPDGRYICKDVTSPVDECKTRIFKPCDGNPNGNTPLLCPKFTKNIGNFACSKSPSASDVAKVCGGDTCTSPAKFTYCSGNNTYICGDDNNKCPQQPQ